jgi:hypothetical protein
MIGRVRSEALIYIAKDVLEQCMLGTDVLQVGF